MKILDFYNKYTKYRNEWEEEDEDPDAIEEEKPFPNILNYH